MTTSNLVSRLRDECCDDPDVPFQAADEIERLTNIVKALSAGAKPMGYECPDCHQQIAFGDSICRETLRQHAASAVETPAPEPMELCGCCESRTGVRCAFDEIERLRGQLDAAEQHVRILQAQVQSFAPETSGCQHDLLKPDTTIEVIDKWKAKCKECIEFFDLPGRPEKTEACVCTEPDCPYCSDRVERLRAEKTEESAWAKYTREYAEKLMREGPADMAVFLDATTKKASVFVATNIEPKLSECPVAGCPGALPHSHGSSEKIGGDDWSKALDEFENGGGPLSPEKAPVVQSPWKSFKDEVPASNGLKIWWWRFGSDPSVVKSRDFCSDDVGMWAEVYPRVHPPLPTLNGNGDL